PCRPGRRDGCERNRAKVLTSLDADLRHAGGTKLHAGREGSPAILAEGGHLRGGWRGGRDAHGRRGRVSGWGDGRRWRSVWSESRGYPATYPGNGMGCGFQAIPSAPPMIPRISPMRNPPSEVKMLRIEKTRMMIPQVTCCSVCM